jgi:hypothetical protein
MTLRDQDSHTPAVGALLAPLCARVRDTLGAFRPKTRRKTEKAARLYEDFPPLNRQHFQTIENALTIPAPDATHEYTARMEHQTKGQFLSRQEDWPTLSQRIEEADQARTATPGGMPIADLLTYGARADIVLSAEHALFDGKPSKGALEMMMAAVDSLEAVLLEHPNSYPIALVVAHAHMDIGWAWRGTGWETELNAQNRDAFAVHFARAAGILNRFSGAEYNSPALAAAHCALLAGNPDSRIRVADEYEVLIDLDRANPRHMRAMGNHLLPRWFGTLAQLELEARRTASRTQGIWGAGAYAWVYFDALVIDDDACAQVDLPFFIEGLRDILTHSPDQHNANLLAAYCSVAVRGGFGSADEADLVRTQIIDCTDWIIRDHLREIHPLVWAHAAQGFNNSARINSLRKFADRGRRDAMEVIASLFSDDIAKGRRVTFTPTGLMVSAS